jgi:hypothetical protein
MCCISPLAQAEDVSWIRDPVFWVIAKEIECNGGIGRIDTPPAKSSA